MAEDVDVARSSKDDLILPPETGMFAVLTAPLATVSVMLGTARGVGLENILLLVRPRRKSLTLGAPCEDSSASTILKPAGKPET
jgi:hypothetical protein